MQLAHATWLEVEEELQTFRGILIPIGSTEQHGPNGLIGTDHLCAEAIARGLGEELNCFVAPTLSLGMSQQHMSFAGGITLRPSTMIKLVQDVVHSLNRSGFERFFFINGHGGNIASVNAAFDEIYSNISLLGEVRRAQIRCKMVVWSRGPRTQALSKTLYADANGAHATATEISLTQYYHPQSIKTASMDPKVASPVGPFYDSADYRRRYPDGRCGSDPSLSSPAHGELIYRTAIADMKDDFLSFMVD